MRTMLYSVGLALAMLALGGCAQMKHPSGRPAPVTQHWREVATEGDRERLRDWRSVFVRALAAARQSGHSAEIARDGALLQPDAALAGPSLPNGLYRCRIVKLGASSEGTLNYISYPAFTCRVVSGGGRQMLTKLTGSQRQVGTVYPADMMRQVFLGTMVLGDERGALRYGQDDTRDVAGYIERVGPARWRLLMPRPRFESQLDVMELVPMSQGVR